MQIIGCLVLAGLGLAACSGSQDSGGYRRQADQLVAEDQLAEAVLTYRQALISRPDDPDLLSALGTALAAQGRDRSAAYSLHRAAVQKSNEGSIGHALAELTTRPRDGLALNLAWLVDGADSEPVGAAVASGRIFVAYAGGRFLTLDQSSGNVLWDVEVPAAPVSPPTADANQVWVGAEDGSIVVYEASSGRMLGSYHTGGAVYAAPVLTSDIAFCGSSDGTLYALDRRSLQLVWKTAIGAGLQVSPLVSAQSVYVGSNDGRLYRLSAATGERIWPDGITTQGAIESVPTLAEGRIFVGSGDGRIYALDSETGTEYWRFSTPDAIYASPLVMNDQLVVASSGQILASLRLLDGSSSWSLAFEHALMAAPALFKNRLYVAARADPRLFAVKPQTGELLGELNTGDWIADGPHVAGTDLILVGKDGAVFLYR